MSKSVAQTMTDLAEATNKLDELRTTIEQQNRRSEESTREIARLRDQLRDVFGAVYVRLDGSVKQGTVYVDMNGPMHEVREPYLQPVSYRIHETLAPSHIRHFRLMGQVGKLYVYGEV